jgi:hypothetical protein
VPDCSMSCCVLSNDHDKMETKERKKRSPSQATKLGVRSCECNHRDTAAITRPLKCRLASYLALTLLHLQEAHAHVCRVLRTSKE